jgi:methylated-DNA-[protein]-cysteine S-methyltransferase
VRFAYHVASSPLGLLFLARGERGLRYLEFMDRRSLQRVIEAHAAILPGATWEPSLLELKPVVDQLEAYFSGAGTTFDVPLDPAGSEFQRAVWRALTRIPYGETRSYGQIARAVGQPNAARAVGLANHDNPIAVIIPCHRVVGADGSLTGYGGGLPRKRWLLEHESHVQRLDLGLEPARASTPAKRAPAGRAAAAPARRPTAGRAVASSPRAPTRRAPR